MSAAKVSRRDARRWWSEGLSLNLRIRPAGIAISLIYAVVIGLAREISWDQFYLPAGVRIAALLLISPRYWGYLLIGEYSYFAWLRHPMIDQRGMTWVVLGSISVLPAAMLLARLHRNLLKRNRGIWLISMATSYAVLVTTINVTLACLLWPVPSENGLELNIILFLAGDFTGILTIVPLALLWREKGIEPKLRFRPHFPTIGAVALIVLLGSAAAAVPSSSELLKTAVLLLMAFPAVLITYMHGWRGAAISVPLCTLTIRLVFHPQIWWIHLTLPRSLLIKASPLSVRPCSPSDHRSPITFTSRRPAKRRSAAHSSWPARHTSQAKWTSAPARSTSANSATIWTPLSVIWPTGCARRVMTISPPAC
jgi:hypothetical protein